MTQFDEPDEDEHDGSSFVEAPGDAEARRSGRIRYTIIAILFGLAVILFAAERFYVLVRPNLARMEARKDAASVHSLEQDVMDVLDGYGIRDTWVKKRMVALPADDSVRSLWMIGVPPDVPLASVNFDLKQLAGSYNSSAFAVEDAKTRQVFVHMRFHDAIRYSLVFTPDRALRRAGGMISILVDGIEKAGNSEIEEYLAAREPIACILVPDKDAPSFHDKLKGAGKEIVLHVHVFPEETDAGRYSVNESMRTEELQRRARLIQKTFPAARMFYVTSERAFGAHTRVLEEEFQKLGLLKIETSGLSYIDRTSQFSSMSSRMNDLASLAAKAGTAAGVLELKDGILAFLRDDMMRLRKKGFEFISAGRYLRILHPATPS